MTKRNEEYNTFGSTEFNTAIKAVHQDMQLSCREIEFYMKRIPDCRAKSIALTKLEEFFMWTGKACKEWQDSE